MLATLEAEPTRGPLPTGWEWRPYGAKHVASGRCISWSPGWGCYVIDGVTGHHSTMTDALAAESAAFRAELQLAEAAGERFAAQGWLSADSALRGWTRDAPVPRVPAYAGWMEARKMCAFLAGYARGAGY